jgi:hypothetical protein
MGAFLQESRPGFAPALDGTFSCFMARTDRIPLGGRSVRKSHVKAARRDARAAFLLRQARLTDSSEVRDRTDSYDAQQLDCYVVHPVSPVRRANFIGAAHS